MRLAPVALFGLTCALAACGGTDAPPPTAAAQPAQPLPNSNVFSADVRALQKAKDVQKVVDQQKDATDKQVQDEGH
jgi:hypothetical protein